MAIVRGWRCYVTVQPPAMIVIFAISMLGAILTELILYRMCTITLNINKTECLLLKNNGSSNEAHKIIELIQPDINRFNIYRSVIESLLPAFLSFFVGPWSDSYGRKPLLFTSIFGYTITFVILSLMSNWSINPWYFLTAFIPIALFGGFCFILLASFSYISDITSEDNRTWHLACFDLCILFGLIAGIYVGPLICKHFGYTTVFSITAILLVLANLFLLFFVPETIQRSSSVKLSSIFDMKHIYDLLNTFVRTGNGFNRFFVWCCSIYLLIYIVVMEGDFTVMFLFTNTRLGWDATQYSYYMIVNIALEAIGSLIGIKIFSSLMGFSEINLAIFSTISSLSGALMKSFTWLPWQLYLSIVTSMFGGVAGPSIRSALSKSVPANKTGKLFSLITTIQTLTPIAACSLYSTIYSNYLPPIYPSPVWLVSSAFYILMTVMLICIKIGISRTNGQQYVEISQESE